jgi:hypothetical protein
MGAHPKGSTPSDRRAAMSSLSTPVLADLPTGTAAAGRVARVLAALALVGIALSPLLWAVVPPLVDYPNHLARMWILAENGALPALAANYAVAWRLLPNLGMDLVVPALAQVMPLELAGRLFIALTMLSLVAGTAALHRALHGRVGVWPLGALLFLYNAALFWGFLNCLFGVGLFLLTFAGWIASRAWRPVPRLVLFGALASLLLVLHLFAFGLYALAVGSYELGLWLGRREFSLRGFFGLCARGLQFVPGGLLWLASLSNTGQSYTRFGDLAAKVYALQSPFTFGPEATLLDKTALLFCVAFLISGIAARALKLAPEMRLPLLVLTATAALMPNWLSGSWLADIRIPAVLPFVAIAAVRLDAGRMRTAGLFAAMALALLGIRVWTVTESWREADRRFEEFRTAAKAIAPGARLLVVAPSPGEARPLPHVPVALAGERDEIFTHMAALAVIDRSAFIPYLFTGWTPMVPTARNAGLFQSQAVPLSPEALRESAHVAPDDPAYARRDFLGERPYWGNWPEHFDFVLWMDFAQRPDTEGLPLDLAASGDFFGLYRVTRP